MPPHASLLDRRLVIVTGKGGTGKTSVAAALALAGARAGRRVLAAEVTLDENLPRLFDADAGAVGYEGRELRPGLRAMRIDPYEALSEYLGLQIGGRALVGRVLRNRSFRQLMDASPGWRELITLGKVWHLEQMESAKGEALYDLVVVDAPATGHGISFLDVPRVVISAVRAGPLRRHAGLVETMIEDADRTLLLPVSLAEELPARETAELVARVRDGIGIAVDRVVVNAVTPNPFPAGLGDLDERLGALPYDLPLAGLPAPSVLAACTRHLRERHELNEHYVDEIARDTGLPVSTVPFLVDGVRGPEGLLQIADALLAEPEARAA